MKKYDNIIVGAGITGLVAAGYLAKEGQSTLVIERTDHPGGRYKLYPLKNGGFAISQGPQMWLTNRGGFWMQAAKDLGVAIQYVLFPQGSLYIYKSHKPPLLNPLSSGPEAALKTVMAQLPKDIPAGTEKEFLKVLNVIADLTMDDLKGMGDTLMTDWLAKITGSEFVINFFANLTASQMMFEVEQCKKIANAQTAASSFKGWFMGEAFISAIYPDPVNGFIKLFADAVAKYDGEFLYETEVEEVIVKNGRTTGVRIKGKDGTTSEIESGRVIVSSIFNQIPKLFKDLPDELAVPIKNMESVQLADYYIFCELSGNPGLTSGYCNILDDKGNNLLNVSPQSIYMPWSIPKGKHLTVNSRVYTKEQHDKMSPDEVLKQVVDYQEDLYPGFKKLLENITYHTHFPLWHHCMIAAKKLPNTSKSIKNLHFVGDSVSPQVTQGTDGAVSTYCSF
jgi:phytoene dehydrogenase-like protein